MVTRRRFHYSINLPVIGLHFLFWVLIVIYFAWGFGFTTVSPKIAILNGLFFLPGHITMAYGLLYFLVPKYLLQQKFWHFLVGFLILLSVCAIYAILMQLSLSAQEKYEGVSISFGRNVLPFVHVGAIAASIKLLKYWYLQKKRTIEAEQQRTVAELKLLKAHYIPIFYSIP